MRISDWSSDVCSADLMVRPAHLHLLGRDRPDGSVEVDLIPFGVPQFAGTDEDMWQELHGKLGQLLDIISIDRTQQLADTIGLDDRPVLILSGRTECAAKVAGGVQHDPGGCHTIAKYQIGRASCRERVCQYDVISVVPEDRKKN